MHITDISSGNLIVCTFFSPLFLFRSPPSAYGRSQIRGQISAVAASLRHSHSNIGSETHVTYTHGNSGSLTHWMRPGIKLVPSWILVRFVSSEPWWEFPKDTLFWLQIFISYIIFHGIEYYNFFFSFSLSVAYGGSQARGLIRAAAAGLSDSHSNTRSEPYLQPTSQLTAMPDL